MDLDPTPDQALLLESSARLVDEMLPLAKVRAIADGSSLDPGFVSRAADLGWFAMLVDEGYGGGSVSGDPVADIALIARSRGARLLPEPFTATNTVAALLGHSGSDEQRSSMLPVLASGEGTAAIPVAGDSLWGGTTLSAEPDGEELVLSGTVVIDDPRARWLLLTMSIDGKDVQTLIEVDPGLQRRALNCLDVTRRLEELTLDGVRVPRKVLIHGGVEHSRTVASVLTVAESVGAMDRLFDLTRQYALDRIAFGRPIGSFQAIKHLLADVSLVVESSKAVLDASVRALSEGQTYASEVSSIAATYVGERAARMAQDCLQVHGGIGFAWEHDLHLYLRRLTANAALFGTTDFHRSRILRTHADELQEAR
ncbi:acyl-CoA dehydrogenase family protein [Rhodococcus sp. OK302]|uniref:acyl-CoA dehydrogenase family protein n=1 Tax=Rhodococcus sp. OK302 TaxID=1882769 RepID=UPI000B94130F|nr:acyl-CoA dehydrogenase family protein [Rhodococcus sp. OK302]OYD61483.1 alkylation response protein AidB-like acyl-CoA dehydrogenase [Rhodococcus sp. OK302]